GDRRGIIRLCPTSVAPVHRRVVSEFERLFPTLCGRSRSVLASKEDLAFWLLAWPETPKRSRPSKDHWCNWLQPNTSPLKRVVAGLDKRLGTRNGAKTEIYVINSDIKNVFA